MRPASRGQTAFRYQTTRRASSNRQSLTAMVAFRARAIELPGRHDRSPLSGESWREPSIRPSQVRRLAHGWSTPEPHATRRAATSPERDCGELAPDLPGFCPRASLRLPRESALSGPRNALGILFRPGQAGASAELGDDVSRRSTGNTRQSRSIPLSRTMRVAHRRPPRGSRGTRARVNVHARPPRDSCAAPKLSLRIAQGSWRCPLREEVRMRRCFT